MLPSCKKLETSPNRSCPLANGAGQLWFEALINVERASCTPILWAAMEWSAHCMHTGTRMQQLDNAAGAGAAECVAPGAAPSHDICPSLHVLRTGVRQQQLDPATGAGAAIRVAPDAVPARVPGHGRAPAAVQRTQVLHRVPRHHVLRAQVPGAPTMWLAAGFSVQGSPSLCSPALQAPGARLLAWCRVQGAGLSAIVSPAHSYQARPPCVCPGCMLE